MIILKPTNKKLTISISSENPSPSDKVTFKEAIQWVENDLVSKIIGGHYLLEKINIKLPEQINHKVIAKLVKALAEALREIYFKTGKKIQIQSTSKRHRISTELFEQVVDSNQTVIRMTLAGGDHWRSSARDFILYGIDQYGIQKIVLSEIDTKYFDPDQQLESYKLDEGEFVIRSPVAQLTCEFSSTEVKLEVLTEALKKLTPAAEVVHLKCKKLFNVTSDASVPSFVLDAANNSKNRKMIIITVNQFDRDVDFYTIISQINQTNAFIIFDDGSIENESIFSLLERMAGLENKAFDELPVFMKNHASKCPHHAQVLQTYCNNTAKKAHAKINELREKAFKWDEVPTELLFKMIASKEHSLEEIKVYIEKHFDDYRLKTLRDKNSYGVVHYAARYGRVDLLKHFAHMFLPLDVINQSNGNTALHVAAYYNQEEVVNYLVKEKGMPLVQKNIWGDHPFKLIFRHYNSIADVVEIPSIISKALKNTILDYIKDKDFNGLEKYIKWSELSSAILQNLIKDILLEQYNELGMNINKNAEMLTRLVTVIQSMDTNVVLVSQEALEKLAKAYQTLDGAASSVDQTNARESIAEALLAGMLVMNQQGILSVASIDEEQEGFIKRCVAALAYLRGTRSDKAKALKLSIEQELLKCLEENPTDKKWKPDVYDLILRELTLLNCPLPDFIKTKIGINVLVETRAAVAVNPAFAQIQAFQAQTEKTTALIEASKQRLQTAVEQLAECEAQIQANQASKEAKEQAFATTKSLLKAAEKAFEDMKSKLIETLFALDREEADAQAALKAKEAEKADLEAQYKAKEVEISGLFESHRQACAALQAEYTSVTATVASLGGQIASQQQEIQKLSQYIVAQQQQYAALLHQIQQRELVLGQQKAGLEKLAEENGLMEAKKLQILFLAAIKRAAANYHGGATHLIQGLPKLETSNLADLLAYIKSNVCLQYGSSLSDSFIASLLNEICKKEDGVQISECLNTYLGGQLPTYVPTEKLNYRTPKDKTMQSLRERAVEAFSHYEPPKVALLVESVVVSNNSASLYGQTPVSVPVTATPTAGASVTTAPNTAALRNPYYAGMPHNGTLYAQVPAHTAVQRGVELTGAQAIQLMAEQQEAELRERAAQQMGGQSLGSVHYPNLNELRK